MTEVIVLPPGPEPKKKTAYYQPKNLQEQLMAFLNYNNKKGFAGDPEYKYEPPDFEYPEGARSLITIFLEIADKRTLTVEEFRIYGHEIKKSSGKRPMTAKMVKRVREEGVRKYGLPITKIYDIMAVIFGYDRYQNLREARVIELEESEPIIVNKRQPGEFKAEFFPDIEE